MYYIKGANKVYGCSEEMLHTLLKNKRITLDVLVSTDQKTWQPLKTLPGFSSSASAQDTPNTASPSAAPQTLSNSAQSSTAAAKSSATAKDNSGASNPTPGVPSVETKSAGNSSGAPSFDFLHNNNSSSPSGNPNNSYPQQQNLTTPTQAQSVPAQQAPVPSIPVQEEHWFLSSDGVNAFGPYPISQVVAMIQNGQVYPNNFAWRNGENPTPISNIPSFANFFNIGPVNYNASMPNYNAPMHPMPIGYGYQVAPCSRTTYVLLGIFFGCLGIHNFYAGYSGKGIFQLLSILFCFGWVFVPIWVLIEICTVTCDAKGVPFV